MIWGYGIIVLNLKMCSFTFCFTVRLSDFTKSMSARRCKISIVQAARFFWGTTLQTSWSKAHSVLHEFGPSKPKISPKKISRQETPSSVGGNFFGRIGKLGIKILYLHREWHKRFQKRSFTCIPRPRHAGSPQRAHFSKTRFRSVAPTAKSWPQVTRNAALATQNHPQTQVPKMRLGNWAVWPQNMASMVRIPCACHVKRNPANDTRLPTFLQRAPNICACHEICKVSDSLHLPRELTFSRVKCNEFLAPAMQNALHFRKRTSNPVKRPLQNRGFRAATFARACAVETKMKSEKGILAQTKRSAQSEHPNLTRVFTPTVGTPRYGHTVWGMKTMYI